MKVLLVFPPVHPKCDSIGMRAMPPLALYYLSSILKDEGFEVNTVDPEHIKELNFLQEGVENIEVIKKLNVDKYDVVAFSVNSGNWAVAKIMIELIKDSNKNIPIIVGGVHASYFDEYILNTTPVDYVVRGEGEKTLPLLLNKIEKLESVEELKGITYKNQWGKIVKNLDDTIIECKVLDNYPRPSYDALPDRIYTHLPIETSRGCKFNCMFCSVMHKKTWRALSEDTVLRSVNSIVKNMKAKTLGGNQIYFVDDCFSADINRALSILNRIKESDLDVKVGIECRVTDLIKPGFIENIPKDVLSFMQIGVELGYDEGLRKIRKGITIAQVEKCAELIYKHGLENIAYMSFIVGFPWETLSDMKKTIHMIGYLGATYGIRSNVSWLWICPSDLWSNRHEYNIDVDESIFDDPLWITSKEVFCKTHPNINNEVYEQVENLIFAYRSSGVEVSHAKLW